MSWWSLFGNTQKEKHVPVLNALEQQRLKQIETLRTYHPRVIAEQYGIKKIQTLKQYMGTCPRCIAPNVTEVRKDKEYQINIFINENALDIHVYLPPNFPNEIPVVTVSPPVQHPWVNDQMVVIGCDAINRFYMHSNLGRALQDVCKQFHQTPPTFCQSATDLPDKTSRCFDSYEPPAQTLVKINEETRQSHSFSSSQPLSDQMSEISETLDSCSIEELKELDSNPEKLLELVLTLNIMPTSAKDRENQMSKIEEIAKENLEQRQTRLEAARARLLAKYEALSIAREKFDHWSSKQNDLFEMHTPHRIQIALQIAAAQADEEAENIAEDFLNEKIEIEEFMKRFVERRKLTHMRHWKEENVLKL